MCAPNPVHRRHCFCEQRHPPGTPPTPNLLLHQKWRPLYPVPFPKCTLSMYQTPWYHQWYQTPCPQWGHVGCCCVHCPTSPSSPTVCWFVFCFFFFVYILEIELWALRMLNLRSTAELHPQLPPLSLLFPNTGSYGCVWLQGQPLPAGHRYPSHRASKETWEVSEESGASSERAAHCDSGALGGRNGACPSLLQ